MNLGLSYVGVAYQVAAEAIVPLNTQGGHGVGVAAGSNSSSMISRHHSSRNLPGELADPAIESFEAWPLV
jgi:hypothetical protein